MQQKIFVEIDYFTRIFAKTFKFVGKRADCLRIAPVELSFYKKRSLHLFELWRIHFVTLATNHEWYHSLDQDGLKCWRSYDRTLSVMIQGTSSEWTKSLRQQGRKQSGIFFGCYSQYFFRENDGRNVSNALFFDDSAIFNPVVAWPVLSQISLDLIWTGTTANTRGDLQTPLVLDFALKIPQVKIIPITMCEFTFYILLWYFIDF